MKRLICRVVGTAFLLVGLVLAVLPIPFGIPFILIGLMLLIPSSPLFARWVRRARARFEHVDGAFAFLTQRTPVPYRRILRATEPGSIL